jgi:hypothetical protein
MRDGSLGFSFTAECLSTGAFWPAFAEVSEVVAGLGAVAPVVLGAVGDAAWAAPTPRVVPPGFAGAVTARLPSLAFSFTPESEREALTLSCCAEVIAAPLGLVELCCAGAAGFAALSCASAGAVWVTPPNERIRAGSQARRQRLSMMRSPELRGRASSIIALLDLASIDECVPRV